MVMSLEFGSHTCHPLGAGLLFCPYTPYPTRKHFGMRRPRKLLAEAAKLSCQEGLFRFCILLLCTVVPEPSLHLLAEYLFIYLFFSFSL